MPFFVIADGDLPSLPSSDRYSSKSPPHQRRSSMHMNVIGVSASSVLFVDLSEGLGPRRQTLSSDWFERVNVCGGGGMSSNSRLTSSASASASSFCKPTTSVMTRFHK